MDRVMGGRAGNTPKRGVPTSRTKRQVERGERGKKVLQEMSCQPKGATKSTGLKAAEVQMAKGESWDRDQRSCSVIG